MLQRRALTLGFELIGHSDGVTLARGDETIDLDSFDDASDAD